MAQKKGFFVIKNAVGTVTLAGRASALLVNSNNSASITDATAVTTHVDSSGVPRAITRNFVEYTMDLDLTPGIGGTTSFASPATFGSKAAVVSASDLQTIESGMTTAGMIGQSIVTTDFDMDSMNWDANDKAVITAASVSESQDGLATVKVTASKRRDLSGNAIDFTGAWAAI